MEFPSQSSGDRTPSVGDLLENITFPHLRHLRVTLRKGANDKKHIQILSSHAAEPTFTAVAMDLGRLSSLGLLFACMPSVTELQLEVAGDFAHTLSAIAPVLESDAVLPRLETLQITDPPEYPAGCDALIKMLHARRSAQVPGWAIHLPRPFRIRIAWGAAGGGEPRITLHGYGITMSMGGKVNIARPVDLEDNRLPGSARYVASSQFLAAPASEAVEGSLRETNFLLKRMSTRNSRKPMCGSWVELHTRLYAWRNDKLPDGAAGVPQDYVDQISMRVAPENSNFRRSGPREPFASVLKSGPTMWRLWGDYVEI
ncbi:hypothetical protein DFH09DRAFT_1286427 [Mycena vulgaris]|nr:hypothetical protein DFH09DRAFT_1286427 [Mycena vulgaris]